MGAFLFLIKLLPYQSVNFLKLTNFIQKSEKGANKQVKSMDQEWKKKEKEWNV